MTIKTLDRPNQQTLADRWLAAFEESRADLLDTIQPITHDLLHWRPFPQAHSIADYLWHMANVQLWWVQRILLGRTLTDSEKTRYGLTTPGDIQQAPVSMTMDALLTLLDETRAETVRVFYHMPDVDFTTANRPLGRAGSMVSPEWVLYNLVDHEANHRGQIAMIARWGSEVANQ